MPDDVVAERPAKDTRFDPSRIPVGDNAKAVVREITGMLLNYEQYYGLRQRARRAADQERFNRIVSAILCEMMHAVLSDQEGWRHISMSKRHRPADMGAPFMTEDRIKIIQWMLAPEMMWIELEKGNPGHVFARGRQSRIRASARLRDRMDEHDIQFEDIGRDPSLMGDPIVLRSPKLRREAKGLPVPDGEPTETFRYEMLRINESLANADIDCDFVRNGGLLDVGNRWMRRIFNDGRMDQGGRLIGGFWQTMKAAERLENIQIDGEPVVSLDFGQCAVRIAYGQVGATPPEGDLYSVPGLERYRKGVKIVLNAMLSRIGDLRRKPNGSAKHFHRNMTVREIEEPILSHHNPIRHLCYTGLGLTLQFIESQVLVRAMLTLAKKRVSVLPIHDCLLAPASKMEEVRKVMLQCFKKVTGVQGDVSIQRYPSTP